MNKALVFSAVATITFLCHDATHSQSAVIGPTSSLEQIVSIRIVPYRDPIESQGIGLGSGIVIGRQGDDILVVTSSHNLKELNDTTRIIVGVGAEELRFDANVLAKDPIEDLAIIRMQHRDWFEAGRWKTNAPRMLRAEYTYARGAQAFVLGCPFGACWASPIEARIVRVQQARLDVRTASGLQGHSGGALVDHRGLILGIFTNTQRVSLSTVVKWPYVLQWLATRGIAPDLPTRVVGQRGDWWIGADYSWDFRGGRQPDGSRTWPSTAVDIGYSVDPNLDLTVGYRFLSISQPYLDAPSESFLGNFLTFGFRYLHYTDRLEAGARGRPSSITASVNYLWGSEHELLRLEAIPDSFDLHTGNPVLRYRRTAAQGNGWAVRLGMRGYVYRGIALDYGLTYARFSLSEPSPFRSALLIANLQIGISPGSPKQAYFDEAQIDSSFWRRSTRHNRMR